MCGPMRGSDGRVEKVVCAGGFDLKTVEVYDLRRNSWSTGKFCALSKTPTACNMGIEMYGRKGDFTLIFTCGISKQVIHTAMRNNENTVYFIRTATYTQTILLQRP